MNTRFLVGTLVTVFVTAVMMASPEVAMAANPLVPCTDDCGSCELVKLANTVISWLIGILFMIFAVLMTIAGFGLVTSGGNQAALESAKSKFKNAIIGIIIVFAAWLLVDTLLKSLLNGGTGIVSVKVEGGRTYGLGRPWQEIQCFGMTETRVEPNGANEPLVANAAEGAPGSVPFTPDGTPSGQLSAVDSRAALEAAGVLDGGRVISYDGMRQVAIDGVIQINNECGCGVTITEVTGGTHSMRGNYRHDNGYKVDIRTRDNPQLVEFVQNNFTRTGTWSTGEPVYERVTSTGLQKCAFHSTHMDCQFIPGG